MMPADRWPVRADVGPWSIIWHGGRLADVHHAESMGAVHCLQVWDYDARGPYRGTRAQATARVRTRLAAWADVDGPTYVREVVRWG